MQQYSIDIQLRNFFGLLNKKLEIIDEVEEKHSKMFQVFYTKYDIKCKRAREKEKTKPTT